MRFAIGFVENGLRLLETGKRVKTLRSDLIENYRGARQKPLSRD